MKILADIHTHATASGHAYSTIHENILHASKIGLKLLALTDHAPGMPSTTTHLYFANLGIIPSSLYGVKILKGIELNIMDINGTLDLEEEILSKLDIAIASLHVPCIAPGTREENTQAVINAMRNPWVDIIGHLGDPRYDLDFAQVFEVAKETGTLIEVNNASLVPGGFRFGSDKNIAKLLKMAMAENVPVVLGSDAHFFTDIADFSSTTPLLEELQFPEELILNTNPEVLLASLKRNKRK